MKLANYSPDVTRLRRIAKACAAGELSRSEYRRARREVIANLAVKTGHRDDTVPRFDGDTTVRRDFAIAERPVANTNRLNLLWLLLFLVVLGTLAVPGIASSAQIPPVKERPVDPALSPRYDVTALEADATVAQLPQQALEQRLVDALARARQVHTAEAHGFTEAELEQVARFLNAMGIHDPAVRPSREDVADLKALVDRQKQARRVSLHQLEGVAKEIQAWVRAQGYPLAVVYLPAQTVEQGVVQLAIAPGVLREIEVEQTQVAEAGTERTVLRDWPQQMANLIGTPVVKEQVESQLNIINRVGGETVQAAFAPGTQVGDTRMLLRVVANKKYRGMAQLDNYGPASFGQERLSYHATSSSLLRAGDRINAHVSRALGGEDHLTGGLGYRLPLADRGLTLGASIRYADLDWRERGTTVEGNGLFAAADAVQTFTFTRTQRRELRYAAGVQDVSWDTQGVTDQQTWYLSAHAQGHQRWDAHRISLSGDVGVTVGGVDETRADQDSNFAKLDGHLFAWRPLGDWASRGVVRARWQWSADRLPVVQQASLSQPFANSGLEPYLNGVDSLVELGTQLHFNAPIGEWWWFTDAGFGQHNDAEDTWQQLVTTGFGWQAELLANHYGRLSSQITVGHPLVHKSNGELDDDGTQVYWSLRFTH